MEARRSVARGSLALTASQFVAPLFQAVQLAVVSRAVGPSDLGEWVIPAVVLAGEALLFELGLHAALARRPLDDDRAIARRWAIGACIAHGAVVLIAAAVDAPWTALALAILPVAPLSALSAVGRARLAHGNAFARVARIELEAAALGAAVACALAVGGAGIWSLAVSAVGRSTYLAARVAAVPSHRRAGAVGRRREAHLIIVSYVFVFIAGNVDYALATRFLADAQLGIYFVAFNVAAAPVTRVGLAANRVIIARLGAHDSRRVISALSLMGALTAATLCWCAPALPAMLGERWRGVVDPIRIFGAVTGAVTVGNGVRGVAIALDRDRRVAIASAGAAFATIVAVLAWRPADPGALARAVAVASFVAFGAWLWALPAANRHELRSSLSWTFGSSLAGLVLAWDAPGWAAPALTVFTLVALVANRALVGQLVRSVTGR